MNRRYTVGAGLGSEEPAASARPKNKHPFQSLSPGRAGWACVSGRWLRKDRYLVDPASSHMLVSKIKPCMSKYKRYTVKLRMAH